MTSDANAGPCRPASSHSTGASRLGSSAAGALSEVERDRDALFLDVDGTLLQIAHRPEAVRVPAELLAALQHLEPRFGGALALISGRSIADLDSLFSPLRLPSAGVHGLERRSSDGAIHRSDVSALLAPLRLPLDRFVRSHDGLLLEDKGQSLALHFRNAPACAPKAEALLRDLIATGAAPLELKRGKMVLEVKPGSADKGTAIAAFMQEAPFAGRRPVFVGDDVTDEDGFAVVNGLGGLSIRVGARDADTLAQYHLPDEQAVLGLLLHWAGQAAGRDAPSRSGRRPGARGGKAPQDRQER